MALIKFSALVSEMRNKLNGSVLSKNRGGNYMRNKTTPVNPQTSFQQNVRAVFAAISQSWRGLTEQQRQSFRNLANQTPYTDIFGDQRWYDGKAMYQKLNVNLVNAGASQIAVAPTFVEVPFREIEEVTADIDGTVTMELDDELPVGYNLVVEATEPLPASIGFVKNRFRQIFAGAPLSTDPLVLTSYYADKFGSLAGQLGKSVHFRAKLVNTTTGQVSLATEASAIVEDGNA